MRARGPVLRLKRGHDRARAHPWVFKGEVADVSAVEPGDAVTVVEAAGAFVGRGWFNPGPTLCCRIATRVDEPLDGAFLRRRLRAALALRAPGPAGAPAAARLVWSEGDLLPGLIVDRYGEVLVVQCQTLALERRRDEVVGALREVAGAGPLFHADDAVAAAHEGFAARRGWHDQAGPARTIVAEGEARLAVTFGAGQKTGLYLDQAANRRRAGALGVAGDVLDAFAYHAGFAVHALRGNGTGRALCLESSPEAVAAARENLELNGLTGRAEVRAVNAFDELRRLGAARARFELIVLDPPPFARSRATLAAARRGYKEINLRALRLLTPGGRLLTFSCSHHVGDALFEDVCREAAADAGVTMRVVERLTQAPDHPAILTVPETRYLKGLHLQAVPR